MEGGGWRGGNHGSARSLYVCCVSLWHSLPKRLMSSWFTTLTGKTLHTNVFKKHHMLPHKSMVRRTSSRTSSHLHVHVFPGGFTHEPTYRPHMLNTRCSRCCRPRCCGTTCVTSPHRRGSTGGRFYCLRSKPCSCSHLARDEHETPRQDGGRMCRKPNSPLPSKYKHASATKASNARAQARSVKRRHGCRPVQPFRREDAVGAGGW